MSSNKKGEIIFMVIILLFLFALLAIIIFELGVNQPIAMGKAHQACQISGYDYADKISRVLFSDEPTGVKCGIIEYSQKQIRINSTESIPIVIGD
jgi:uncharacterized membrane protein